LTVLCSSCIIAVYLLFCDAVQREDDGDGDAPVAGDGAGPSSRANDDQQAP
jgi:hypothetical protein